MKLFLDRDFFDNPKPTPIYLCNTSKKIIGELKSAELQGTFKWNSYSEINFIIHRTYVDILTGETVVDTLFDKVASPRNIYVKNIGFFQIQDVDSTYSDKDEKSVTAFSLEYASLGTKYLENFKINTGEVDSTEVLYNEKIYGIDYKMDSAYKLADGEFDAYTSYYYQNYTNTSSYVYEQIQINDANEYASHFGNGINNHIKLYVKAYKNVQFYNKSNQELSLLHLILKKAPEWEIGHVDTNLWRKERKFEEDRVAIYDFLVQNVCDTFKCVIEFDTISGLINVYEEVEDGVNDDNTIQTRWDTDIYVSRSNLANEIQIKESSENIKTKLKVSGADDLDIREVNLGKNYIMNLDYYHTPEWMEQDLFEAYTNYLDTVKAYSSQYIEATQGWVATNNKYNDLMNAVPVDGNIVLVSDAFEKLYCVYAPIYENGATQDVINSAIDTSVDALSKKLKLYQVHKDTGASKSDNILLRLKNSDSDMATIRVYNSGTEESPNYQVKVIVTRSASGLTDDPLTYTLRQWVTGQLTADKMKLDGFSVNYIGTMGAYFVLAKDETVEANIEDYGVNLLREKKDTYTTIFQTQTEAMYSQEKYQCTASDEPPIGNIAEGTRWLDTNSNPIKLYQYTSGKWTEVELESSAENYENYQRYIDNYNKLQTVQTVLAKKEKMAGYYLNGYAVEGRRIVLNANDGSSLEGNMQRAAQEHFAGYTITRKSIDMTIPLYTFTTSYEPDSVFVVYLKGTTPYVAYEESQGLYMSKRERLAALTDFESFFTKDQWIRLSPFIREDEFTDDNFLLTGYESEEERLNICKELVESANKELNTLCQPSLEFSMTMANILALPEFKAITNQFQLGNFIRVHVRDGYVKRARLLEVNINFDDLSDFSCSFGNLITAKSEIDKHAELLSQAVTAGKQVAQSAGEWQRGTDKANKLETTIANGLQDVAIEVGKASGQSVIWDQFGIWGRKLVDGTTDQYEPEQFRIINNKLVFSNDGFKTSKAMFGRYFINGEERWGPLAEYVTADMIEGKKISGGSIEIGTGDTKFVVHEDGSVEIKAAGADKYATVSALDAVSNARQYHIELFYDNSTIFGQPGQTCTLTCKVYEWENEITDKLPSGTTFSWLRNGVVYKTTTVPTLTITNSDIDRNAIFTCSITFDETQIK